VAEGLAETEVPVVALSPAGIDQVYVEAPLAVSVPATPLQIVMAGTVTVGSGLTVTTTVVVFIQPAAEVPVTV
jgi:hypothetical protein